MASCSPYMGCQVFKLDQVRVVIVAALADGDTIPAELNTSY